MAVKGRYTRLLAGSSSEAWEFTGVSNSLEVSLNVDRLDATAFQDTGAVTIAGDTAGTITQNGYFDSTAAAGDFEKEIYESIANGETLYVGALFGTETDACPAYVARATNTGGLTIGGDASGLLTVQGEWFQGVGIVRGVRVWRGTISATGAQTSPGYIDLGAVGSAGGYAWLWVTAVTGTATSATILLQSDDNTGFSTPATEATFTFSSASGRAQEQALSGTVDRYLRLSTSSMGGATNFTVCVVAAVSGITY
jgi:hypothetical protein